MKLLTKCLKFLLLGFLCLILLINFWQLFSRIILKDKVSAIFGYAQVTVMSGSMEPVFSAGDVLIIHNEDEYKVKDIVTFWRDDMLVTHRLIEENDQGWITKGDYNNTIDSQIVQKDQIIGKVIGIIPYLGFVIMFFRTPLGILILIVFLFILLVLPEWLRVIRHKCKNKKNSS